MSLTVNCFSLRKARSLNYLKSVTYPVTGNCWVAAYITVSACSAILAEVLFPSVNIESSIITIYASRAYIVGGAFSSLLFLLTSIYIARVCILQIQPLSNKNRISKKQVIRDMSLGALLLFLAILFGFGTLYLSTKSLTITDKGVRLSTFFETKEILWDESKIVSYAFRPSFGGNTIPFFFYTYIDFVTKQGEVVHFNLQYMKREAIEQIVQHQEVNMF
jgi:hypothetical protein